jgi:hypothetical protein
VLIYASKTVDGGSDVDIRKFKLPQTQEDAESARESVELNRMVYCTPIFNRSSNDILQTQNLLICNATIRSQCAQNASTFPILPFIPAHNHNGNPA